MKIAAMSPREGAVIVADYGGYPFTFKLAKNLARDPCFVTYAVKQDYGAPNSAFVGQGYGGASLSIERQRGTVNARRSIPARIRAAISFGWWLGGLVRRIRPSAVIVANMPPEAIAALVLRGGEAVRLVWWVQDLFGPAAAALLGRKSPMFGRLVGSMYSQIENAIARRAQAIVVIDAAFRRHLPDRVVGKTRVVANWAPVEDISVRPKANVWAARAGLDQTFNFIYTGTLGKKHNPRLLLDLAKAMEKCTHVRVVVVSEGPEVKELRRQADADGLNNLLTLPFQSYESVPDVMGAADVLIALLESDAGAFSVPSKVLAYLCSARPVLAAIPSENASAQLLKRLGAGRVTAPGDAGAFIEAARILLNDDLDRATMGRNGREYAEREFAIGRIGQVFREVLSTAGR